METYVLMLLNPALGTSTMNKPDLKPTILILILLAITAYFVIINADKMDETTLKADLEVTVSLPEPCETLTMQATALTPTAG